MGNASKTNLHKKLRNAGQPPSHIDFIVKYWTNLYLRDGCRLNTYSCGSLARKTAPGLKSRTFRFPSVARCLSHLNLGGLKASLGRCERMSSRHRTTSASLMAQFLLHTELDTTQFGAFSRTSLKSMCVTLKSHMTQDHICTVLSTCLFKDLTYLIVVCVLLLVVNNVSVMMLYLFEDPCPCLLH